MGAQTPASDLQQLQIVHSSGYAPPGGRSEELERDVPLGLLKHIRCEEIVINSPKKISLSGIVVRRSLASGAQDQLPDTVIVYFQGISLHPQYF